MAMLDEVSSPVFIFLNFCGLVWASVFIRFFFLDSPAEKKLGMMDGGLIL